MQTYPRTGLAVLGACLAVTGVSAVRIGGSTALEFILTKARWHRATTNGTTAFTAIAPSRWRLPGPLVDTRMIAVQSSGRAYGAIHQPRVRRIAVSLDLASTAVDLTDAIEHDVAIAAGNAGSKTSDDEPKSPGSVSPSRPLLHREPDSGKPSSDGSAPWPRWTAS